LMESRGALTVRKPGDSAMPPRGGEASFPEKQLALRFVDWAR